MTGSQPSSVTQTSTSEPPAFVQPFSEDLLSRAEGLSTSPFLPLPGAQQRVAPFSQDELLAQDLLRTRALEGSPEIALAREGLTSLIGGASGGAFSPLTDQLVQRAQGDVVDQFNLNVAPSTAARFAQGNNLGSTAFQETDAAQRFSLARALGDVDAGIRGSALDRSLQAIGFAPALAEQDFRNLSALQQVGTQQRGLDQLFRDIDFQNILTDREEPLRQLDILASAINTASGGFGTVTTTGPNPNSSNSLLGGIGAFGSLLGGLGGLIGGFSSEQFKVNTADVVNDAVLTRVENLPIRTYEYVWDEERHIGPFAEDFKEMFGVGDGTTINYLDAIGVLLASVKALTKRVKELENGAR